MELLDVGMELLDVGKPPTAKWLCFSLYFQGSQISSPASHEGSLNSHHGHPKWLDDVRTMLGLPDGRFKGQFLDPPSKVGLPDPVINVGVEHL